MMESPVHCSGLGEAARDLVLDEAMNRPDVKALKEQLEKLQTEAWNLRVNNKADELAAQLRGMIVELGGTPCA